VRSQHRGLLVLYGLDTHELVRRPVFMPLTRQDYLAGIGGRSPPLKIKRTTASHVLTLSEVMRRKTMREA